jgi:hypothetical protein
MIFLVENETDDVALLLNVEPRWPTLGYVQTQKKLRTAPQEEDWTKR